MRSRPILLLTYFAAVAFSWGVSETEGQQPGPSSPVANQRSEGGPAVSQRELETYYLEREDGSLKPFFNIPFEEWDELYKLYKGLKAPDQPPRYLLRDLRITGEVIGDHAFFTVKATAIAQRTGWVRVPLNLNQAMVVPEEDTSGDELLELDRDGDGLVWRVNGKQGQRHTLTTRMATKLRRLGGESLFELSVPNATTSRFQLVVPESDLEVDAGDNAFLLATETVDQEKTRINLDGIGGPLRLRWQKRETRPASSAVIKSETAQLVEFEHRNGQNIFRLDAAIDLSLSNGSMRTFIIRLPPEMDFTGRTQPGYSVRVLPTSEVQTRLSESREDCQYIEVQLDQETSDRVTLRLFAEHQRSASAEGDPIEMGGLEVVDAVSQTGTIALAAQSGWSLDWSHDSAVERLAGLSDALRRQGVIASFRFHSQPYSLRVTASRKESRVHVEPTYELSIETDRVMLKAQFTYRPRGGAPREIVVDLSEWQVDEVAIGEESLLDSPSPDTLQPLRLSLSELSQVPDRDFELNISAVLYRSQEGLLRVPLPAPVATSQGPAQLVVRYPEQLKVTPLLAEMEGLTPVAGSPTERPSLADRAIFLRGWARPEPMVFAAETSVRSPETNVTVTADATLAVGYVDVAQQLVYRVLFEPVSQLQLRLPASLLSNRSFSLQLDGEPVDWIKLDEDEVESAAIVALDLDSPATGAFRVSLNYRHSMAGESDEENRQLRIPLATPVFTAAGRIEETTVSVVDREGRGVQADQQWSVVPGEREEDAPGVRLRAKGVEPVAELSLKLSGRPLLSRRDSIVEVAWLQTWLNQSRRSDRLALRLTTSAPQLRFRLPAGAALEDVAVDQRQVTRQVLEEAGDVIVRLGAGPRATHVVELWYSVDDIVGGPGQHVLDMPRLLDADWTRRFYWQLVLPRDEHLLLGPGELTSESSWNWRSIPIGRRPRFHQRDLEHLVGASEQLPLPDSTNQYLLSSQESISRLQVTTVGRGQVLLAAGLLSFFCGLLLIYFAPLRHPAALLASCTVLVSLGLLFPYPVIQLAQLATVGILFALIAWALKVLLTRSRSGPAIVHGSSLSSVEAATTESLAIHPDVSSQASTQALPIPQSSDSISG